MGAREQNEIMRDLGYVGSDHYESDRKLVAEGSSDKNMSNLEGVFSTVKEIEKIQPGLDNISIILKLGALRNVGYPVGDFMAMDIESRKRHYQDIRSEIEVSARSEGIL